MLITTRWWCLNDDDWHKLGIGLRASFERAREVTVKGPRGEFFGKTVLITGGGGGIGRALATAFGAAGASIVLADVVPEAAVLVRDELQAQGTQSLVVAGDVADPTVCRDWVRAAIATFGALDVLVNNAGIGGPVGPIRELALKDWSDTIAINLTGAMLCSQAALDVMLPRKQGNIINISSNVGKRGLAFRAPYVVSKWGMLGLTQTLALEVAKEGIRVNAICPGPIEGERVEGYIRRQADALGATVEDVRQRWLEEIPMRRMVTPSEVAQVALFLASERSSAMIGQAVNVTAGLIMD